MNYTEYSETPFIRQILDAPDDDLPRLVFADYLEENGETERAPYIRISIALYRDWRDEDRPQGKRLRKKFNGEKADLLRLQRLSSSAAIKSWKDALSPGCSYYLKAVHEETVGFPLYGVNSSSWGEESPGAPPTITCQRGFPARVQCSLAHWCGGRGTEYHIIGQIHDSIEVESAPCPDCDKKEKVDFTWAKGLLANFPIQTVEIDLAPREDRGMYAWDKFRVPRILWVALLKGTYVNTLVYRTAEEANQAMSNALLSIVKSND